PGGPAGGEALDTEKSNGVARGGGICRGEFVWAWAVGKPRGGWAHGGDDRAGCVGWAYCATEEFGDSRRRAARYSWRPHDRKRVLHVFRGGGDGVAVAARFLFCAGGGDGFSAGTGHARGSLRLGRECDAANMVGPRAGGVAVEPRFVCGDEMPVLLLPGIGVGVDARAGGPAGRNDRGLVRDGSHW